MSIWVLLEGRASMILATNLLLLAILLILGEYAPSLDVFLVMICLMSRINESKIGSPGWHIFDHLWVGYGALFWPIYARAHFSAFLVWCSGNVAILALNHHHPEQAMTTLFAVEGTWALIVNGLSSGTGSYPAETSVDV